MAGRMAGKVALITGGGGGIGAATGRLFVEEGASIALVDRDGAAAEEAAAAIRADHPAARLLPLAADLTQSAEAQRVVQATAEEYGGLDSLINIAGVRVYGPLAEATPESWAFIIGVNVMAAAYCCQAAVPLLRARGGGTIVNMSSVFGITGRAGMSQYDTTKAALLGMTRALAVEEAPHGIRVNAILPGPTITPFHIKRMAEQGVSEAQLRTSGGNHTLFQRMADPREVALPILFLACDESSYCTGIELVVDGGARIK